MSSHNDPSKPTVFLVDGSGYIFRAYFAVRHLSTRAGLPTNAVFGFVNMLLKMLKQFDPKHIAMVFDTGAPTFRHEMYDGYKANRPPPPEDLVPQFALIQRAVKALAMPQFRKEGYEADDLIGSLARQARDAGHPVLIMTGDKDLMQLVDDKISLYDGMKDKHIGPQQVLERFGVTPDRVIDVLALAGDSSDNVPGVQGIGVKTAAQLVQDFGGVEEILTAADTIKQKARRERLIAGHDMALLSKRLVTIDQQAPVNFDLAQLHYHGPDVEACRALFTELEFTRLLNELPQPAEQAADLMPDLSATASAALTTTKAEKRQSQAQQTGLLFAPAVDRSGYRSVSSISDLNDILQLCRAAGHFALDTETDSLDPMQAKLVGLSLAWAEGQAVYIPCGHDVSLVPQQLTVAEIRQSLQPLLDDPSVAVIAQNGKFDRGVLISNGFAPFVIAEDPMLASYLLDADASSHGLDALSQRHLGHVPISFKEVCGSGKSAKTFDQVDLATAVPYAAEDADLALRLHKVFAPRLVDDFATLYRELELPLARLLGDIQRHGVVVDAAALNDMSVEFATEMQGLTQRCHQLAGHDFNVASPKQVATVLFTELKLPAVKKTKTGASTDAAVLEQLSTLHELPKTLLEYRLLAKLKNTYVDVLPKLINPRTGRVHTQFNQAVAATGRLSSSDPNLQNIPVRSPQGRRIRQAFIAPPGRVLLSADYSQIELRVLAHVSQDPAFVQAFVDGQDIHARTASEIFDTPLKEVSAAQRRSAKAINFGLLYGMGAFRLGRELGIPNKEAQSYLDAYFARYAGIRSWHEQTLQRARIDGYVTTLFGRRRSLRELSSQNHNLRSQAERMATNTPIQGSAADIIKRAMLVAEQQLAAAAPSARLLLQVHDELIVEVDAGEAKAAGQALLSAMQGAAELRVPLVVDLGQGQSWAEAH